MRKSFFAAALMAASLVPGAAMAQSADVAELIVAGAKIQGPEGGEVGTVKEASGGNVVVDTGMYQATLPANVFGRNDSGLVISFTKEQLNAAVAAAEAKSDAALDAALVPETAVMSSDGVVVGKVRGVEGDNVTIDLESGSAVALKRDALSASDGGLVIAMTAADFTAAVSGSAPAATETAAASEAGDGA